MIKLISLKHRIFEASVGALMILRKVTGIKISSKKTRMVI
jgi:hypothetical protein